MVDLEQVGVPAIEGLLKAVGAHRDLCAGVYADVVEPEGGWPSATGSRSEPWTAGGGRPAAH